MLMSDERKRLASADRFFALPPREQKSAHACRASFVGLFSRSRGQGAQTCGRRFCGGHSGDLPFLGGMVSSSCRKCRAGRARGGPLQPGFIKYGSVKPGGLVPFAAYSSKRLAESRSRSYRLASGKGGSQDSRRTIQLS